MLQLIVNGIVLGSIIALAAIGLTMVYGVLNFANFSHADFMTFGAYIAFVLNVALGLNIILSFFIAVAIAGAMGVLLDFLVWKPMRRKNADLVSLIIVSIGLSLIVRNAIIFTWGGSTRNFDLPVQKGIEMLGITITHNQLTGLGTAILFIALVHFFLKHTKMGKAMRAISDDINLARISGIDSDKVIMWMWFIGIGLAGVAGILYGLETTIRPNMGWFLILPMFAAVILGGIGNPYGAMVGGMVIGLSQELSMLILPSEYKMGVSLGIMILVLLFKPEGLFGGTKT
ncbi:MAG: branched-chain amino acid ABC transporter permease [ANME-2 cluster archaeon]|nr:branched-chain amino acid ABC transporter permease [ANME-2 cluster archaeon]MBC2701114.1 branched-chain amino acid ABC transporter permease [ANME-2 cluster archaeon]MBC2707748.1 branched-chain amino acid ABC transporter permease [ANME-2 cluster archaeon]MBC2748400.1 branched-chain amino acid ABC transporter permease [ANME-2 cluster archaeon]MBC2764028.1 branched-chain amino acid ABC transporter permease [ANME-2 cluster archaeon]